MTAEHLPHPSKAASEAHVASSSPEVEAELASYAEEARRTLLCDKDYGALEWGKPRPVVKPTNDRDHDYGIDEWTVER